MPKTKLSKQYSIHMKYTKSVYFVKSFFAGMRLSFTGMKSSYTGMRLNFTGIRLNSEVYIKTTFLQISNTPKIEND